jgi:transcriptional regulator with XRE-family HTH domain
MKNKNIHTMKQPELGIRISELRKEKGLTQEELVEQCNINVRTIQRIEAGDVSPRSYTIKAILDVLGFNYEDVIEEEYSSGKFDTILGINTQKIVSQLNIAWIFGIIYFIVSFIEIATEYYRFEEEEMLISKGLYIVVKVISIICFVLFYRGFVIAGSIFKNYLLEIMAFLIILVTILVGLFDIISLFFFKESFEYLIFIKLICFGIFGILLGIGMLKLSNTQGVLSTVTGVFEILTGFLLATILFADIGLFLLLPLQLLEIILLYKIVKTKS